jgi:hypothetical protein
VFEHLDFLICQAEFISYTANTGHKRRNTPFEIESSVSSLLADPQPGWLATGSVGRSFTEFAK